MMHPRPFRNGRIPTLIFLVAALGSLAFTPAARADGLAPNEEYLAFIRASAKDLRANDQPPTSSAAWEARKSALRLRLSQALAIPSGPPAPLDPLLHGTVDRDGYKVEKLSVQTLPGVRMTANLYLPNIEKPCPAILAVHGHWRGAKQDPVVQSRCIGAVKLGFVVLAVDALGAGERGIGKALGEYHGEMTAATLLPAGLTLAGLQVYENGRALEYLKTRPEVDASRLGVTGASGGGNQTMYAAALLEPFSAAVPVCSVGNYQSYLGAACCMCEVVPGGLTIGDEWGVLGLFAPKALMVVNATKDATQFSVPEARKTVAALASIYSLYDRPDHLKHAIFESTHDYNRPMREAAYGWFARALKGAGTADPIAEPEVKTEDPETLRIHPGASRPDDFVTIPKLAALEAKRVLARHAEPADPDTARKALVQALGGFPELPPVEPAVSKALGADLVRFESESGLHLNAHVNQDPPATPRAILLDLEGREHAWSHPIAQPLRDAGWNLVSLDLRATGPLAPTGDKVGRAPDHNSAEWGLWIGRPLLGQWVVDVRRLLDALEKTDKATPRETVLIGLGPAGLVALATAAVDPRVSKVAAIGTLASHVTDAPFDHQRLGTIVPGLLRDFGDVAQIAALVAPRQVVISGGVNGSGNGLSAEALRTTYAPAADAFKRLGKPDSLVILDPSETGAAIKALKKPSTPQ